MKIISLILIMWFLCPNELSGTYNHNQKLNQYLNKRFLALHDRINEKIRTIRETSKNESTMASFTLGARVPPNVFDMRANIFTFFKKTFFVINEEIFLASLDRSFNMESYGDFTDHVDNIFFKTIEFHKKGFIALGTYDEILIFTFPENSTSPRHKQTIYTPFNSDAIFFTNRGHLYLASASNRGTQMGLLTIYQWLGSYFDEIQSVYTTGPTFLGSFPHKKSEIIIVGQRLPEKKAKIYSVVFQFRNKKLKKILYLNANNPTHMDVFFQYGRPYVLIYEESQRQLYFKWNGYEMVLLKMFHWKHRVDKSMVVYIKARPLIVYPQMDQMLTYKPQKEDIVIDKSNTKKFFMNYAVILDINKGENENGNITFMVGLTEDSTINIYAMSLKMDAEMEKQQDETLPKCFNNLQQKVYDRRKKLNQMNNTMSLVENAKKNTTNSRKRQADTDNFIDVTTIENQLEDIKSRIDKIKPFIIKPEDSIGNDIIVNGKAIIKANVIAKNVTANNLNIEEINGKKWLPQQWLRYHETQTITGPSTIGHLITNILVIKEDSIFKNLLMNQGNQKLTGKFKFENITASEIFTNKINNIHVENIYIKSNPILIKGLKTFENIFAKKARVHYVNNKNSESSSIRNNNSKSEIKFAQEVFIENLEVESIDNINWAEFEKSLFKIGEDDTIEGNLIASDFECDTLNVKYLNGINTDHIMTKSTNQVINSTIEFNNIEASNIECNTVNDIDINKSAAIDQDGTVIKGPVRIAEVHVKNDLELTEKINQSFLTINETNRIWGTHESDLLQRYFGKVLIRGNLYVNDLSLLPNTTIFINNNEYTLNSLEEYWTKNSEQIIPVHFEAQKGLSIPHLKTRFLNTIPINNFALNDKNSTLRGPIFFENVTVNGDVFLNKDNHNNSIDLAKLALNGIRKNGGSYRIKGKKVFKNKLNAKHLQTSNINEQKVGEKTIIQEKKVYKKLILKGDLISNINAETVNGINISNYRNLILALDSSQNMTNAMFRDVAVENLYVSVINGHNIMKYLEKLEKILADKQIKTVQVKGNVTIQQIQDVKTINGKDIVEFLEKNIERNEVDADLRGDVNFTGHVKVGNLRARDINGINFPELTRRLFYKESNQSVSGIYTFRNLKTKHLYAEKINEQNVTNLIDISSTDDQELFAPKGIVFKNVMFGKPLSSSKMLPCDVNKAMTNMQYPKSQEWARVEISGNVKIMDENCVLNRILGKSVKKDEENVILAPITINGHVVANRVKLFGKLNDINLSELIEDAVLSDTEEEQLITGHKIFPKINANTVTVLENADIPRVNNIYIPELYKRIIRIDEVNNITILGKKTFFGGLQTDKFFSDEVSGIKPGNIVNLANLSRVPNALLDSLEIKNDLNVKFINSYDLNYILNNRLFTDTSKRQMTNAIYFFSELEIEDNLRTSAINNIKLRDVVFDLGKQKITAPKRFLQNITVFGNISIGYLNGINISEAYENALIRGREEVINGSITILKPVRLEGNVTARTLNGYPIEKIKEIMESSTSKKEEGAIFNTTEKIKSIIFETLPAVQHMPNELMYIERSEDLQIKIRNAIDARVTVIKDYALIHVLSEESNIKCNLPEGCKCPVQHTVEITPHLSVSYFLNKGHQRIYSYDDDTMTIHLITNSISTDTYCRTNQTKVFNEMSTMSWSTSKTRNTTKPDNLYPPYFSGYISGAEFFTLNDVTYAIVARYYDPVADTHDLDCTVLKFSDDKDTAMEIQKIPTRGVWTLYLLHTAQGVTLVIGNLAGQPYTEIYRFNEEHQQFQLLRSVAYGCTKAVGVVLGTDSLIILANKNAPLQVLKYNSYFDNYYYYQMFALDEPVVGISVFYVGGFGISDAYLCIVTEENYRIYSFQYIDGWKLESTGIIRGLRNLIPVELNNQLYLFAPSSDESSLLTVVKHGAGET